MMATTYPGFVHLNGNLLAAIDFETTGKRAGWAEIIQVAVLPLNSDIRPLAGVRPFYMNLAPKYPERAERAASLVHGLDLTELMLHSPSSEKVADLLVEWWQKLDLPMNKCLVPLAHNWAFESAHGKAWLGDELFSQLFHSHARDAMLYALALNDKSAFKGEPVPFAKVGLGALCNRFNIDNPNHHDALNDCIVEAEVYRSLLHYDLF